MVLDVHLLSPAKGPARRRKVAQIYLIINFCASSLVGSLRASNHVKLNMEALGEIRHIICALASHSFHRRFFNNPISIHLKCFSCLCPMALSYDMMADALIAVSFVAAVSSLCYSALNRPSSARMPRSRSRRLTSKGAPAMTNVTCKELIAYSPTYFILPGDYYLPAPCYSSVDQCFLYVPNMNSLPYGPHAVQLYTPPAPIPEAVPLPSQIPISVIYPPPFMIPPYHYPYGPTAVQIYSPYTPPLMKMKSIQDVIGLGQDDNLPLPSHHSEATPVLNHSMLSALPSQSVDFSAVSPHCLVCPVLGLFLVVAVGVYALFRSLKKLRHHEPEEAADNTEEYHSAPSSFHQQGINGFEHKLLKKNVNHCIPENEGLTRNERLNADMESRSIYHLCGGFPSKTKFATKKRRLTSVSTKTKFVPKKRKSSDFSMHLYQLDVIWSRHNEPSIAGTLGTFALYSTLYCALKRRRCLTPDVDDFVFEGTFSDPSWTDVDDLKFEGTLSDPSLTSHTIFKENISELHSSDSQNNDTSLSERWQMCAQSDVHDNECDFQEFIAKSSFYEPDDIFEHHHFQQEEECDHMSKKNDESLEHIAERLNEHTQSRMDDHSLINIAEEVSAEPPELLGLNEDPPMLKFQNINVAFAEGDQIWAQNSISADVGNHECEEKLLKPSDSSSVEIVIAEPNNVEEKECHNFQKNDNLILSKTSKKKLWWRSDLQNSSSRWYIATGMGKSSRRW